MKDTEARTREFIRRKAQKLIDKGPMKVGDREIASRIPTETLATAMPGRSMAEAIVNWNRPVLVIADDRFAQDGAAGGEVADDLLAALESNRARLDAAIPSVGRIELAHNVNYPWVGTGWLIASDFGDDIVVTNAHVAREFGMKSAGRLVFRPGIPDFTTRQSALIDFREELGGASAREFPITSILWISEEASLDMALLKVARTAGAGRIGTPIPLWTGSALDANRMLAVIGYPGSGGGYDPQKFGQLFGPILGKKRFSPGLFDGMSSGFMTYDASTLPGSSGSVVVDVQTGAALGLHFAGTAFEANYAVTAANLHKVLKLQPWRTEAVTPKKAPLVADGSLSVYPVAASAAVVNENDVRIVVPLQITVRLGQPGQQGQVGAAVAASLPCSDKASADAATERVRAHLQGESAVLSVTADYLFRDGEITDDYGVIVKVRPGGSVDAASYGLGANVDGVALSVEFADPETVVAVEFGMTREAFGGRRAQYARDLADARFDLSPVTDEMRILLHASPEAGWPVLKEFLERTNSNQLTVGMYHMTAPHVVEALKAIADRDDSTVTLTIDRQKGEGQKPDDTGGSTKAEDIPEKQTLDELERIAGNRFEWTPASLGGQGLFPTAYHIKVAVWGDKPARNVRNDRAFWLSSGNWQSSNQAPLEVAIDDIGSVNWGQVKDYNREWHAVVEHQGLATTFGNHLAQDFLDNDAAAQLEAPTTPEFEVLVPVDFLEAPRRPSQYRAFPPLPLSGRIKVQPLLTPDNYPEVIADLISRARERVLIENQSFAIWKEAGEMPEHFVSILEAIKERQSAGLDVRVIFRSGYGKQTETLRRMKAFGFQTDRQHARYFDTCHNKGIVIDKDIVVLGSQNLTGAGTGPNRDASLVIWDKKANSYFAELFEYDWLQVATNTVRLRAPTEAVRFVRSDVEEPLAAGLQRISLAEYLGET